MSLLDDETEIIERCDREVITNFIKENYMTSSPVIIGVSIDKDPNGSWIVNVKGSISVKNKKIESLTNGLFRFGIVTGSFYCVNCRKLKSLEGGPECVYGWFKCNNWLIDLDNSHLPKFVGIGFDLF